MGELYHWAATLNLFAERVEAPIHTGCLYTRLIKKPESIWGKEHAHA